ncbi:MAG: cell division protein ZapA [Candidatus Handelsmanbacteria bacterium]|nr:cell division protein ZapA [Candidatus Handelsmanbacteria bacterium]
MADKGKQIQGIRVYILGEEYRIASEGDPAEVQRVAELVDSKMHELQSRQGSLPRGKVAVLAAMDIAAELLQERQLIDKMLKERQLITERAHESIGQLSRLIDERASLSATQTESSPLERHFRAPVARKQNLPAS